MYPNRIGFAIFGDLKIECLEVYNDNGSLHAFEFKVDGQYYAFNALCSLLTSSHPSIAKLITALGREKFLAAVLEWNPADQATKDSFYLYLAKVANQTGKWDDQPW